MGFFPSPSPSLPMGRRVVNEYAARPFPLSPRPAYGVDRVRKRSPPPFSSLPPPLFLNTRYKGKGKGYVILHFPLLFSKRESWLRDFFLFFFLFFSLFLWRNRDVFPLLLCRSKNHLRQRVAHRGWHLSFLSFFPSPARKMGKINTPGYFFFSPRKLTFLEK